MAVKTTSSAEVGGGNIVQEHAESGLNSVSLLELDRNSNLGTYFSGVRMGAFGALLSHNFPTSSSELWRQTRPDQFPLETLRCSCSVEFHLETFPDANRFVSDQVVLQQGEAGVDQVLFEEILGERSGNLERDGVAALQMACVSALCTIRIKKNCKLDRPILLSQLLQVPKAGGEGRFLSFAPLIAVVLEKGSRCTIIEDLTDNGSEVFFAPRLEFLLERDSRLSFVSIQEMNCGAYYLARHRFHLGHNAKLSTFHAALGAAVARVNLDCRFYHPNAEADLASIYLADESRHVDFHPVQEHLAPGCRSELFCRGVLKESARGVYYGLIKVAEGADKTDAFQRNKNLLLSNEARVDTVPNLEIRANDVKCSHGAAVGQVGEEELYYLMSRGLPKAEAEKLLVEGFFEDLLEKVSQDTVRDLIRANLLSRLRQRSSIPG